MCEFVMMRRTLAARARGDAWARRACSPLSQEPCVLYQEDWSNDGAEASDEALRLFREREIELLIDRGTTIEGVNFFGACYVTGDLPWKLGFELSPAELERRWEKIVPQGTDVLLTHMMPYGILDCDLVGRPMGCR